MEIVTIMSRHNRQAIVILGAASVAIQTIANSFDISIVYSDKIREAHNAILKVCAAWPGTLEDAREEGGYVSRNLKAWTDSLSKREMTGAVMAALSAVATHCVNDLYARPSSRLMRGALDPVVEMLEEIYTAVEAKHTAYEANKTAEEMTKELYKLIDFTP